MFAMRVPEGVVSVAGLTSSEAVRAALPNLKWREEPVPLSPGSLWWAILDGNLA